LGIRDTSRESFRVSTEPGQSQSALTTNAIERLHEEFKRRIKTQTVLPSAETAAMLLWALLASGQITMRKVNGWQTLGKSLAAPVPQGHSVLITRFREQVADRS